MAAAPFVEKILCYQSKDWILCTATMLDGFAAKANIGCSKG